jgi:O-antigen/teichoic acid export membrane protein
MAEAKSELNINAIDTTGTGIFSRISRGVSALSLGAVINILSQISIVPLGLYVWGKIRYGEWVSLSGLVILLRLTDLGLQTFVVNKLCANYVQDDREAMQQSLNSALKVQCTLITILFISAAGLLFIVAPERALNFQTIGGIELSAVLLLLALELLIGVPMGVIAGVYRATGRLTRGAMIGNVQQSLLLAASCALIAAHQSFVILAAARVTIAIAISLFILYDLRKLYPWLRLSPLAGVWSIGAGMIIPGLFFFAVPLADYLANQFTLLVLQKNLDGGEVSRLATHRTVVNLAQMVSGLLVNAVWPELTALHALSRNEQLKKAHRSLVKLNIWLVGAAIFGMLPFISLIYPSWTVGKLTIDKPTLVFLICKTLLWGMWSASMVVLLATNRQKQVASVILAAAIVTSTLSIILVPHLGISGAALASLLGDVLFSAWLIPYFAVKETGDSGGVFFAVTIGAMLLAVLIPAGIGYLLWNLLSTNLVRYLVIVPLISVLALVLMWRQLASYERQLLARFYQQQSAKG